MKLSFAVQILLFLLVLGGALAYIGNYVGRRIGKRRLTVFNLRPRRTATIITIISGILIALSTLTVLLVVSQNARTALFGLEELKKEIGIKSEELAQTSLELERLEKNLSGTKKEMEGLRRAKQKLSREVEISRQGQVLFRVGEVVTISLLQAGPEKDKIEAGLKQILSAADTYIRSFGIKGDKHLIYMLPEDFDQMVYSLMNDQKIYVVKLVTARNVLWGEEVPARFELAENKLIYKKGIEIANLDIAGSKSAAEIEQEIMRLLKIAHQSARDAGILPSSSGSMGSIPYSQIFDLAKKIKAYPKSVELKALASRDVYTIGPLEVEFKISYK